MKKRIITILVLSLSLFFVSCESQLEFANVISPTDSQYNEENTTVTPVVEEIEKAPLIAVEIDSVTRQDPYNTIIMWTWVENTQYRVYRADTPDGEYTLLGETHLSSFRDDTSVYPNDYYYKLETVSDGKSSFSAPVKSGTNPQKVSSVHVIMYHNFITEEDIQSGIVFEEYSLYPEDFESDLIWLRDNGYTTITSEELITHLRDKTPIPDKAVIISIDDGTWGVYTNCWPLLKKYGMKADFNVIGKNIDQTWDKLDSGLTREGESAPYCTWEELVEMSESGEINICSHTYGMHVYDREGRIGLSIAENETEKDYIKAIKDDYTYVSSSIGGWMWAPPKTVAYPYSKRSAESDRLILEHTGYQILMAGHNARGTASNYFVEGCDFENQFRLMSRPCRMHGTPVSEYILSIETEDSQNGVNVYTNVLP